MIRLDGAKVALCKIMKAGEKKLQELAETSRY